MEIELEVTQARQVFDAMIEQVQYQGDGWI